jgi:flagellar basal body rod protein FlgG
MDIKAAVLQSKAVRGQTVRANVTKDNSSGPMIPNTSAENGVGEMSNVDMVKEMLQLIPTQRAYDANLKVIQTNLEMRGNLINMTA